MFYSLRRSWSTALTCLNSSVSCHLLFKVALELKLWWVCACPALKEQIDLPRLAMGPCFSEPIISSKYPRLETHLTQSLALPPEVCPGCVTVRLQLGIVICLKPNLKTISCNLLSPVLKVESVMVGCRTVLSMLSRIGRLMGSCGHAASAGRLISCLGRDWNSKVQVWFLPDVSYLVPR